jgi:hypothetical protein
LEDVRNYYTSFTDVKFHYDFISAISSRPVIHIKGCASLVMRGGPGGGVGCEAIAENEFSISDSAEIIISSSPLP